MSSAKVTMVFEPGTDAEVTEFGDHFGRDDGVEC